MAYRKVFARNTEVREIKFEQAQEFLEEHHSQKTLKNLRSSINLGLVAEDELLAVAQFASPRTAAAKRKYSLELTRLAFKHDVRIPGGASKLLKYLMLNLKPDDFFTYQDMRGAGSDLYAHSGMSLVRQAKKKEYLVAPGKTLAEAGVHEWFSMGHAVRFGPDALVGTKLGEVFRPDGTRKTNPELFVEELGWHVESTPGDRVYEWINPNVTFYTYKITATDSDKYYIGVSHVKKANATVEDCLAHDYYGSGGGIKNNNKFSNWQLKHRDKLQKEVLGVFARKAQAYAQEKTLVGELYKTDPLCLNSTTGGKDGGLRMLKARLSKNMQACPVHGEAAHQGDSCLRCSAEKRFTTKTCSIHGETKHSGAYCVRCLNTYTVKTCAVHGVVKHRGLVCATCHANKTISLAICSTHGSTLHAGKTCLRCVDFNYSEKPCAVHGLTIHRGDHCAKCVSEALHSTKLCPVHGEVTHKGDACVSCYIQAQVKMGTCPTHGETKFQAGKCGKCNSASLYTEQECTTGAHGVSKHRKNVCIKCTNAKSQTTELCERHGLVKHQKGRCCTCVAEKSKHTKWHEHKGVVAPDCSYCSA